MDEAAPARVPRTRVTAINQIGIIVRDIRAAMRHYWETFGIGPWTLYELGGGRFDELTFRGKPVDYSILMALANLDNVQIELIQPLAGEGSSYDEFLRRHGDGVQHLAMTVDDVETVLADAAERNIGILQAGLDRSADNPGGFAYLDTEQALGTVFEFVQRRRKSVLPAPIETYP